MFVGREGAHISVAEHLLARIGANPAHLRRALWLATTPPEEVAEHERRVGEVLRAMRAPGVLVEEVESFVQTTDQTPEQRLARAADGGWCDAVLGRPAAARPATEQAAYDGGRREFERVAAVFRLAQDALQAAAPCSTSVIEERGEP